MKREKAHRAELQRGLLAGLCALAACIPNAGPLPPAPPPGPIGTGLPDPGWKTVDCAAAEAGLEFAPFKIADFEEFNTEKGYIGRFMYSYTDDTADGVYANRDGTRAQVGYEPMAASANVCNSDTTNHVLHVTGGPYLGWGGGIGVAMQHLSQEQGLFLRGKGLCPWGEPPQYDFCPPTDEGLAISTTTLDMSKWDGVAVWARRGPDSQPLLRVLVGNKYVDEDINYKQYVETNYKYGDPQPKHYCERVRECACTNGKDCTWSEGTDAGNTPPGYYCGNPMPDYSTISGNGMQATNRCYTTRCNQEYPAYPGSPDPQFVNLPCTPYAFRNGVQTSVCWDGLDPPPAESDQQCGDYWTFPLHLTTEWQLFLVPFTTMFQQGWAKRWPFFDTSSVSVVRLTWDKGWIDYWIDNLRFYRVRR